MDITFEIFIQVTFVLLILSMINEKLVNFVKLRFPDNAFKRLINPGIRFSKYAKVEDYIEAEENKNNREIQTLAIVMGVALAFLCRANLFLIYESTYDLGWQNVIDHGYSWRAFGSDLIGCTLTGIFLSLGSKFFHDLLGIILETKNLKRKLNDRDSISKLHTIEEFDRYIAEVEPVVVEKKLKEFFQGNNKVQHFEYSESDSAADVYLRDTDYEEAEQMEQFITVELANKTNKVIELNYIVI